MRAFNTVTGRLGEEVAGEYLKKEGYELLARNFRTRFGEIDLVMRDGERLVFVEVKTKKGVEFGMPEEMVGRGKLARVRRMAQVYLGGREVPCRIDVVAVVLDDRGLPVAVRHYENVVM